MHSGKTGYDQWTLTLPISFSACHSEMHSGKTDYDQWTLTLPYFILSMSQWNVILLWAQSDICLLKGDPWQWQEPFSYADLCMIE